MNWRKPVIYSIDVEEKLLQIQIKATSVPTEPWTCMSVYGDSDEDSGGGNSELVCSRGPLAGCKPTDALYCNLVPVLSFEPGSELF